MFSNNHRSNEVDSLANYSHEMTKLVDVLLPNKFWHYRKTCTYHSVFWHCLGMTPILQGNSKCHFQVYLGNGTDTVFLKELFKKISEMSRDGKTAFVCVPSNGDLSKSYMTSLKGDVTHVLGIPIVTVISLLHFYLFFILCVFLWSENACKS